MSEYGWVYCLSNPSYKANYFKIGCTKRPEPLAAHTYYYLSIKQSLCI